MDVRLHPHEADRITSLQSYGLLDSAPSPGFDAVTRMAAALCDAPISAITLVDEQRGWLLSAFGMERTEVCRADTICSDSVAAAAPLVVPDLTEHSRYAALEGVAAADGIRAYAGVPLIGRDGLPLGALCVVDLRRREFTAEQLSGLQDLAAHVVAVFELRRVDRAAGLAAPQLVSEATEPVTLREALDNDEFVAYFQPLVDMRTRAIRGLEALVRWQHPTRGLLTPNTFLAGLETGTLAVWTGRLMLEAACEMSVALRAQGHELLDGVSINVSRHELARTGLADQVLDALHRHRLPGDALTVEVTETAEVVDVDLAGTELDRLRAAGVKVVADDFGVGWSNLVRFLQLPLSGLKIDKALITGLSDDPIRQHMVDSAITLARTLHLDVIAEGVETEQDRTRLLEMGCWRGQGWLFGKATPAADVPALFSPADLLVGAGQLL